MRLDEAFVKMKARVGRTARAAKARIREYLARDPLGYRSAPAHVFTRSVQRFLRRWRSPLLLLLIANGLVTLLLGIGGLAFDSEWAVGASMWTSLADGCLFVVLLAQLTYRPRPDLLVRSESRPR